MFPIYFCLLDQLRIFLFLKNKIPQTVRQEDTKISEEFFSFISLKLYNNFLLRPRTIKIVYFVLQLLDCSLLTFPTENSKTHDSCPLIKELHRLSQSTAPGHAATRPTPSFVTTTTTSPSRATSASPAAATRPTAAPSATSRRQRHPEERQMLQHHHLIAAFNHGSLPGLHSFFFCSHHPRRSWDERF
ncbi:hypothetical protein RHMOL_Rhmol02G0083400 [Rhododendron molle]|uniref:Uncharacterized protein n=1 Tax=Rhododendron molle TaxID=49168 RepID=A0ACC0PMK5_RHOML|nr:hypothetical protein RHMOL_Rhmol02G0083400 [Rhododendron molle]